MSPEAPFQEVKQAVDLSKAEIIVAIGRGIKSKENIALAKSSPKYSVVISPHRVLFVTLSGCPLIDRLDPQGRRLLPNFILRWESQARFSIWWA